MLSYGILTNEPALSAWQIACVDRLNQCGFARLQCVIETTSSPGGTDVCDAGNAFRRLYAALDLPSQRRAVTTDDFVSSRHADAHLKIDHKDLRSVVLRSVGPTLDFVLSFSHANEANAILDVPKHGVWGFAYGDINRFWSDAPAFWEIYYDYDVTGAMLLRLVDSHSAGMVLRSGFLPTLHHSFAANSEALFATLPDWPSYVCRQISEGHRASIDMPVCANCPDYGFPNVTQIDRLRDLVAKNARRRSLFNRSHAIDWNLGTMNSDPAAVTHGEIKPRVSMLCKYRSDRYLADPCAFRYGDKTYVFCEQYSHRTNRGTIAVFEIDGDRTSPLSTVIQEPFHLSYPQVFEYEGAIYCMPESTEIREVRLYRATEFPHRWEKVHTLLGDVAAVDSTLLRFRDKWWLFFTSGEQGYNSHLYIWHATDLFGSWRPHLMNPVKIDVRSAGGAGPFLWHDGALLRPSQDCSRTYGGRVHMNKIVKLSETEFEEATVATINPPGPPYDKGLHAATWSGDRCIVDVKRYVFQPSSLWGIAKTAARDLAVRFGVPEAAFRALKGNWSGPAGEGRSKRRERRLQMSDVRPFG